MDKRKLIRYLRKLAKGKPDDLSCGICHNVKLKFGNAVTHYVCSFMHEWPEVYRFPDTNFANYAYPVNGCFQYEEDAENGTLWTGVSGEKRKRLATWLADTIEASIKRRKKRNDKAKTF